MPLYFEVQYWFIIKHVFSVFWNFSVIKSKPSTKVEHLPKDKKKLPITATSFCSLCLTLCGCALAGFIKYRVQPLFLWSVVYSVRFSLGSQTDPGTLERKWTAVQKAFTDTRLSLSIESGFAKSSHGWRKVNSEVKVQNISLTDTFLEKKRQMTKDLLVFFFHFTLFGWPEALATLVQYLYPSNFSPL